MKLLVVAINPCSAEFFSFFFVDKIYRVYGSGHETVAVLLPGFAINWQLIAKPGNKTAAVSWPDPYIHIYIFYIILWDWNITGCYNSPVKTKKINTTHSQYRVCWWTGKSWNQDISSHETYLVSSELKIPVSAPNRLTHCSRILHTIIHSSGCQPCLDGLTNEKKLIFSQVNAFENGVHFVSPSMY